MTISKNHSLPNHVVSAVCVACSIACCLTTAFAEDDAAAAKAHYQAGVRHFDLSEYEPALADFKEAYRNKPDPVFLYNIAQCHRKLGHTDEAVTFYQSYLRRAPDAKNREEVERRIPDLQTIRDAESASISNSNGGKNRPPPVSTEAQQQAVAETTALASPAVTDLGVRVESAPNTSGAIHERWWFWTAVVAVAASATTVAIIMAERDPTKIPTSTLGAQKVLP